MDRRKAEKAVEARRDGLAKLQAQRERLTAQLEAARSERQKLFRALALGEAKERDLAKAESEIDVLVARGEGTDALILEAQTEVEQAQAVFSEILTEEAREERRRLLEERRTVATQAAAEVRELFGEFVSARGELLVALVRLAELDKAGAQGIASSFTVYGTPGDPMRELQAAGWREVTAQGLDASGPWTIPAMLPPDVEHPFPGTSPVVEAGVVAQTRPEVGRADPSA